MHTYIHTYIHELADTLAKEAATNADITECYKKVPKIVVPSELGVIRVEKWQREWDQTTNGEITREYLPVVAERLHTATGCLPNCSQ
jgi:hypothetical protein